MDEIYVKIKGKGASLYRAVDKDGHTIDFLLTPTRDQDAVEAFLRQAIRSQGLPRTITIDKSGSNTAAITRYNKTHKTAIVIRHSKDLKNIVKQDHRAVKRRSQPMLGFKSFWAARCTIAGIEVMPAIRKGQVILSRPMFLTPAKQCCAVAAEVTYSDNFARLHLNFATESSPLPSSRVPAILSLKIVFPTTLRKTTGDP